MSAIRRQRHLGHQPQCKWATASKRVAHSHNTSARAAAGGGERREPVEGSFIWRRSSRLPRDRPTDVDQPTGLARSPSGDVSTQGPGSSQRPSLMTTAVVAGELAVTVRHFRLRAGDGAARCVEWPYDERFFRVPAPWEKPGLSTVATRLLPTLPAYVTEKSKVYRFPYTLLLLALEPNAVHVPEARSATPDFFVDRRSYGLPRLPYAREHERRAGSTVGLHISGPARRLRRASRRAPRLARPAPSLVQWGPGAAVVRAEGALGSGRVGACSLALLTCREFRWLPSLSRCLHPVSASAARTNV